MRQTLGPQQNQGQKDPSNHTFSLKSVQQPNQKAPNSRPIGPNEVRIIPCRRNKELKHVLATSYEYIPSPKNP